MNSQVTLRTKTTDTDTDGRTRNTNLMYASVGLQVTQANQVKSSLSQVDHNHQGHFLL